MTRTLWVCSMVLVGILCASGQDSTFHETAAKAVVPSLVSFRGTLLDDNGQPLSTITGVTFFLYRDQQGGTPLWMETQNVQPTKNGHYNVMLGTATRRGLPSDLFASGEARWLGVQAQGQKEQARIMLLAVPYALKAADAETVGGLPASAFVLAAPPATDVANPSAAPLKSAIPASTSAVQAASVTVTTSGAAGDVGTIPLFSTATDIEKSILTQTGTTGINVLGKLSLPATGTATATAGKASRPEAFTASAFNSGTSAAVSQNLFLQAEPANNNSASPSGTLNLLYSTGTAAPAETGFKIGSNGRIVFAPGQTFPGAGSVSSVGLNAPAADFVISGSPVTGSGTLGLTWKVAPASADNANAIVKRDSTGSFNATSITGSGTFATTTGNATAVQGTSSSTGGVGVHGSASATGGTTATIGVLGDVVSTGSFSSGVLGSDKNTSGSGGVTLGVQGQSRNPFGIGVLGFDGVSGLSSFFGTLAGGQRVGMWGDAQGASTELEAIGVVGTSDTGVGVFAETGSGGCCAAMVALGGTSANSLGATGLPGLAATAGNGDPNNATNGGTGVIGNGGNGGLLGNGPLFGGSGGAGVTGQGGSGVFGAGEGGLFSGGTFVQGSCGGHCGGTGVVAVGGFDNNNANQGFAAEFNGDLLVIGTINKSALGFQIDHPLDPANKYLHHSGVESPDMMNIYNGNIVLDANGEAQVDLPEWFETLNRDFRYQLTALGGPAPNLYVADEISGNRFRIAGGTPGGKVSWQVTGIRQDAYANAHRIAVEVQKMPRERGYYLNPELFGAPREKAILFAHHPNLLRQLNRKNAQTIRRPVSNLHDNNLAKFSK